LPNESVAWQAKRVERMNVLFLIEAGGKFGLGHLMRSSVLADAVCGRRGNSVIGVRLGDRALPAWALPKSGLIELDGTDCARACAQAEDLAGTRQPDWVVVDGYGLLGAGLVARLRQRGLRVLAFDDLNTDGGGADLVVNQNVARNDVSAPGRLLGPVYALVDPAYAAYRTRDVADTVHRILVTFGGSDLHGLTQRVVAAFAGVPGKLTLDVVIGPSHRKRSFARPGMHELVTHEHPHGLAELLGRADLVISAAGSTCWQVSCAGVPLIAVQTVDNQRELVACLDRQHCALTFDRAEFCDLLERGDLAAVLTSFADPGRRAAMIAAQRQLVDGNGAQRIVAAMEL
jgi:UDP-2,4-diacetamido-2,4,6-trideoxy-beta-L-altropyranose hydrolase